MTGFDVEEFVGRCVEATDGRSGPLAVKEILEAEVSRPARIEDTVGPPDSGPLVEAWHHSDSLTILHIIWPPSVDLFPHDHRMWAVIGLYGGREDNRFFRRLDGDVLEPTGDITLAEGDIVALGSETVHAVANPSREWTGAIHVYGGDYFGVPRTQWTGDPPQARPFDVVELRGVLEDAADRARSMS